MSKYIERITKIESLLLIQNLVIDTASLREECVFGVPDLLRPLCWRLFLNYLPKERQEWIQTLKQRRQEYQIFVDNLIATHVNTEGVESKDTGDHPLSDETQSQWFKYFKDNEVLVQIHKDVKRLRPEIDFFQRYTNFPLKSNVSSALAKRINLYDTEESLPIKEATNSNIVNLSPSSSDNGEFHWQVVERILFVYSKMNPGIKYVQGMNEIVAPIYYVLASDHDLEWTRYAEADCFFCFQIIMTEIKDNFIKSLDNSNCGIESTLTKFQQRLEIVDPELYNHLIEKLDIKPQFFAFRWLSLLLAQEFFLPDLIALWDCVFASTNRMEITEFLCLSMLNHIREELLVSNFSDCMRLLQNYPTNVDVSNLISNAWDLKSGTVDRSRHGSNSSSKNSGRFWTRELSSFVNNARNQLTNYAQNARRYMAKTDDSLSYRS